MQINPINNTSTNFQSRIQANQFFKEALKQTRANISRAETKSMKYAKDFFDNLNIIEQSKKAKEVIFENDHNLSEVNIYEDGKKALTYPYASNFCEGYVAVQAVKTYAESLKLDPVSTLLDTYQLNLEVAKRDYQRAHEIYQVQLETVLDDIEKSL